MRYSLAVAGLVASTTALTTITAIEEVTITSCAPTHTNCAYRQTDGYGAGGWGNWDPAKSTSKTTTTPAAGSWGAWDPSKPSSKTTTPAASTGTWGAWDPSKPSSSSSTGANWGNWAPNDPSKPSSGSWGAWDPSQPRQVHCHLYCHQLEWMERW